MLFFQKLFAWLTLINIVITGSYKALVWSDITLQDHLVCAWLRAPLWSNVSVLDHRSLPPVFKSWHGHIWRLFHLWLCFITFGGCLAHLAYCVHRSVHKTSIIICAWLQNGNTHRPIIINYPALWTGLFNMWLILFIFWNFFSFIWSYLY